MEASSAAHAASNAQTLRSMRQPVAHQPIASTIASKIYPTTQNHELARTSWHNIGYRTVVSMDTNKHSHTVVAS